MIGAGVMVARPSRPRFADLLRELHSTRTLGLPFKLPDQEFLTQYFRDGAGGGEAAPPQPPPAEGGGGGGSDRAWGRGTQVLSTRFNSCGHGSRKVYDESDIVHACGWHKLDWLPLCEWAPPDAQPPFCRTRGVQTFQSLLHDVNPCVARGAAECARMRPLPTRWAPPIALDAAGQREQGRCQWCGASLGCAPLAQSCFEATPETRAASRRLEHQLMHYSNRDDYGLYPLPPPRSPSPPPAFYLPPVPPSPPLGAAAVKVSNYEELKTALLGRMGALEVVLTDGVYTAPDNLIGTYYLLE